MDMTNATQSGPTHGLLDLIFGGGQKESKETQEGQMDPIAALVAALEKQGKEEDETTEIAWTEMETSVARGPAENTLVAPITTNPTAAQAMSAPAALASVTGASAATASSAIDPTIMEAAGGNVAVAALLQKMRPSPEALRAIKNGDSSAVMKLIEGRKAELRGQMPALGLLEKAIEKDGIEKVVGTGSVQQLIEKYEQQFAQQAKARKGSTTEDFLAAKGLKIAPAAAAAAEKAATTSEAEAALASAMAPFGGSAGGVAGDAVANAKADAANGLAPNAAAAKSAMTVESAGAKSSPEDFLGQQKAKDSLLAKSGTDAKGAADAKLFESAATGAAVQTAAAEAPPSSGVYDTVNAGDLKGEGLRNALLPRTSHNITYIAHRGGGQMTMTINPKELGEIQLKVTTNGRDVDVKIVAQNADVANALRTSSSELADALGSQKLNVAGIDVSVKPSANGNNDNPLANGGGQNAFAQMQDGAQDASGRRDGFQGDGGNGGGRQAREDRQAAEQHAANTRAEKQAVKRGPNGSIDLNA